MTYTSVKLFFQVGRILKSHGTGGQLRIQVEERFKGYVRKGAFIFIDLDGSKVPFEVTAVDDYQHLVISLESMDHKQQSDLLAGKDLWIPMDQVKDRHKNAPRHIKEIWEDYVIRDASSAVVYPIIRTEEFPQQLMAIIRIGDREVMIPLHEQLIEEIDREQKCILMHIPEGLLEL